MRFGRRTGTGKVRYLLKVALLFTVTKVCRCRSKVNRRRWVFGVGNGRTTTVFPPVYRLFSIVVGISNSLYISLVPLRRNYLMGAFVRGFFPQICQGTLYIHSVDRSHNHVNKQKTLLSRERETESPAP